jgi:hypothetical protein
MKGKGKQKMEKIRKEQTNLTLRKDIKARANGAIDRGYFGKTNLSKLCEQLLEREMEHKAVPKNFS